MCGIAGFFLKDPAFVKKHEAMENMADLLLLGIESRGRKATGMVAHTPGGKNLVYNKGALTAKDFIEARDPLPEGANVVLLHTRFDTQGSPDQNENNHPVICGSTFVVHNGSIRNDEELFKAENAKREAEVDSEAIAMLLRKSGIAEPSEGLSKLLGPFAIGAIDPIEHPDILLLAKGDMSPLVWHESNSFVVFASTRTAIEDAWKVVLGTPPQLKAFNHLNSGQYLIVTKEGVERHSFEVAKAPAPVRVTSNIPLESRSGGIRRIFRPQSPATPTSGNGYKDNRTREEVTVVDGNTGIEYGRWEAAVRYMRDNGRSRVITWRDYHDSRRTIPQNVEREWEFCKGCRTAILKSHMTDTLAWDRICLDCHGVAVANQPHQSKNPANDLSDDDKLTVENWAAMEAEVHRLTLSSVSADTGFDEATIDFLIFRVPKDYVQTNPKIAAVAEKLDELYQEANEDEWAGFGVEDADRLIYADEAKASVSDSGVESQLALPPGDSPPSDGTSTTKHSFVGAGSPDLTIKACLVCNHRTRWHMLSHAWCNKHFTTCNNCKEIEAHSTAPDGRRLCHWCSRSQKGLLYDSRLEERGVTLAERNPA